ncbi:alpha/beta fold hydrolase [Pannonibacter tanglangensis]|uniref:Alpha/beta fold hydrolase n=1 Tax=Pannonibacter tanglangensis TaxID=2750084 RepID=A0ABW9ZSL1_9HYPH|nr:alpha/beta fold hydrolase [Pannonibacter sp. XCT-34]NBN66017.1 alpha/beta fold hydrolase [Pannonibacter sp. XCT-34]
MSSPASPLLPQSRASLPHHVQGDGAGAPIVLLHGFGGDHQTWLNIQTGLSTRRRTIAFDLPGHGKALDWPTIGNAGVSAKAVIRSLEALDLAPVHLVGHSMGGAVAALVAMRAPERVASLTLLAPGGFGTEINHKLLRRYAQTADEAALEPLLEQFFGFGFRMPRLFARHAAELRQRPGAIEALTTIVEDILDGDGQKTLPREALADLGMPVKLIWGRQDRVLPVHQADALPGTIACHLFDGMGHMPHLENPQAVIRLILEASAAR